VARLAGYLMAQQQFVNLKIKGLYTAPNDFSGVPDGSLDVADDIVIDEESLAESRRGFALFGTLPGAGDRVNRFTNYQGHQIIQYGTNDLAYWNGSSYTTYSGDYDPPDTLLAKCRFFEAQQNLYLSTATGVKKQDVYTATPVAAGVPKGLDLQLALTGSSGFFTTNVAAETTATTTNGSPNLTVIGSLSNISAGQFVAGTGIPSGSTVSSITDSATLLIESGNTTAGVNTISNLVSNTGLVANVIVTGNGLPDNTRISSISGGGPYTVTLTKSAFQTQTGVNFTFSSDPIITMSQNATASAAVTVSFSSGSQVAYRLTWGITDANANLLESAPSQFAAITNDTGSTRNVSATSSIPAGITTSHFYRLYRSQQTASSTISPLDDMQLVYQGSPNSTDLLNGYISLTDLTPDSLRGAYLYTSVSQQQINQANEPPPYCKDFCLFKGFAFYANTKSKQRLNLTILSVGAPSGVQSGNTLTIAGVVYTADTAENTATGHFKVFTTGTPAQNIASTADSLIKVINRYSTNTAVYAYLLSGPTDLPGQILLEEKGTGGTTFYAIASANGAAYSPSLPTSGTTVASAQSVNKNGIVVAKYNQPEAAPSANLLFAGTASKEILRIIPLRDYVIILKQDGIFRLSGTSFSTFLISPFDLTSKILAPDTAQALSNEVWGYFDQGVCSVSDTGVNVRSRPIEKTLRALNGTALATLKQIAFGIGYETDRKYILALPNTNGDTYCQQEYVFHTFTNTWTRWTRLCTAGFIDPDTDSIVIANGAENTVSTERKTFSYLDFVDEAFDTTITASSTYTITLSDVDDIEVGDVLYQSSTVSSVITAISSTAMTVTVQDLLTWSNGAAQILPAIRSVIQWKPVVAGNPIFVRQYSEGAAAFKQTRFTSATMSFYTDQDQSFEDTPLTGFGIATWGNFGWGQQNWGGINRPKGLRFLVPQNKQMCSQISPRLTIRNGYSDWALEGIALSYESVSQEIAN
jgi:hypothetical protein